MLSELLFRFLCRAFLGIFIKYLVKTFALFYSFGSLVLRFVIVRTVTGNGFIFVEWTWLNGLLYSRLGCGSFFLFRFLLLPSVFEALSKRIALFSLFIISEAVFYLLGERTLPALKGGVAMSIIEVLTLGILICDIIQIALNSKKK